MFFQPTALKSSAIEKVSVDFVNGTAVVKFLNNVRSYVYNAIDKEHLFDFLAGEHTPGEFVNLIKNDKHVTCAVFWLIRCDGDTYCVPFFHPISYYEQTH